jgi:hypothetical protein
VVGLVLLAVWTFIMAAMRADRRHAEAENDPKRKKDLVGHGVGRGVPDRVRPRSHPVGGQCLPLRSLVGSLVE